jgi:hypothetical protein
MAVRIEVADGPEAHEAFVQFHDRVYAERGAYWPAFPQLELPFLAGTGPIAEERRVRPLLAYDGDVIAARAVAIWDQRYHRHWQEPLGHVSKFEALAGSRRAVRALMDAACTWLGEQGATAVRTGFGPFDMPFAIDDYTSLPPSILRYNPAYYHALLKDAGFETEQGFVDYRIAVCDELVARWRESIAAAVRAGYRLVPFRDLPAAERPALVGRLFNETFAAHWGMSPVTTAEQAAYLALFEGTGGLDTSVVAFRDDEPVGQVNVVPETTAYARVAPGRTLAAWERLNWLGIGVRKPFRGRGVNLAMASHAFLELMRRGATHVSYTLVLDDNWPSRRTGERLGGEVCASYVAYRRDLRR